VKVAAWAGLAANMTEATNPLRAREGTNKRLRVRVFIGKLAQIKTINKKHKKNIIIKVCRHQYFYDITSSSFSVPK
jgi:hypothetical protein